MLGAIEPDTVPTPIARRAVAQLKFRVCFTLADAVISARLAAVPALKVRPAATPARRQAGLTFLCMPSAHPLPPPDQSSSLRRPGSQPLSIPTPMLPPRVETNEQARIYVRCSNR
jgi:hypothetical protein